MVKVLPFMAALLPLMQAVLCKAIVLPFPGGRVWICGDGAAVYGGEADENGGQEASYSDEFERLHARSLVAAYARTTRCPVLR